MKETLEVVAAVIFNEGAYLCVQKGLHRLSYLQHKFEFPGGKIEPGESAEEALLREIKEELQMEIRPIRPLITVQHGYKDLQIILHAWLCSCASRELNLQEHAYHCWLTKEKLHTLDWAAADLPIVQFLQASEPE